MNTVPLNQQPAVARPPLERNPAHCLSPQRRLRRHCLRTTGPAARPSAQRETAWGTLRKAMSDHRNSLVSLAWPARGATSQGPSGVSTRAPGLHAEATALGAPRLQQELFSPPASFLVRGPGGGSPKTEPPLVSARRAADHPRESPPCESVTARWRTSTPSPYALPARSTLRPLLRTTCPRKVPSPAVPLRSVRQRHGSQYVRPYAIEPPRLPPRLTFRVPRPQKKRDDSRAGRRKRWDDAGLDRYSPMRHRGPTALSPSSSLASFASASPGFLLRARAHLAPPPPHYCQRWMANIGHGAEQLKHLPTVAHWSSQALRAWARAPSTTGSSPRTRTPSRCPYRTRRASRAPARSMASTTFSCPWRSLRP